jgi:hypothetical protein
VVENPRGQEFTIKETQSLFAATYFQGIYRVSLDGKKESRAFNLETSGESDLSQPGRIQLREEPGRADGRFSLSPLWPYLLLLSILLLFLEWYWNPPVLSGH